MSYRHLILWKILVILVSVNVSAEEIAKLYSKEGEIRVRRANTSTWIEATEGAQFNAHDTIKTGAQSRAGVLFSDGVLLRLNSHATLEFKEKTDSSTRPLSLQSGAAHIFSRTPKQLPKIETPIMTASIRGTELVVDVNDKEATVSVFDGVVDCKNQFGAVELRKGEQALTLPGQAPQKRIMLKPLDAVEWALHYPAFLDQQNYASVYSSASSEERVGWDAVFSASKSLSVGDVRQAEQSIASAQANISALKVERKPALQSAFSSVRAVVALTKNDQELALALSDDAVQHDPKSAVAALVRSYVEQSRFDLDAARNWANKAAELDPSHGFYKARQAEVELGFGERDKARELALSAVQGSTGDAYALTVLGFTELSKLDPEAAEKSFSQAIELDPSSGLPRLGLGLSLIRMGNLSEGRVELQKAVHLEPNVALFRSYLGKAFFEEELESNAEHEYLRAMEIDPLDPTPHLYSAFNKLSTHRPVEALFDLEESIKLNDNRAVYRSKLLLDEDSAVRSAGLSEIFSSVGFTETARIEAIKSLNKDYSNYSAHLLLSEAYDSNDFAITAGLSELLISRLLSPVAFNLIRPSSSGGVSSGEFNALFDRPVSRTQIEATGDTKRKLANGHLVQTGASGKSAYAIDYDFTYADGFRDNDREKSHLLYLSFQHQLTPNDTLLFDGNLTTFDDGDTELGFDPEVNDPEFSNELEDYFLRAGINHEFGPRSKLIAQAIYSKSTLDIFDHAFDRFLIANLFEEGEPLESIEISTLADQSITLETEGLRFDTQFIKDTELVSVVLGVGISDASQDQNDEGLIVEEESILTDYVLFSDASHDEKSERIFAYTTWHLAPWIDLNLGANYTHLTMGETSLNLPYTDGEDTASDWYPKLGVVLYPTPELTVRGAYFESVGTSGVRELELIEPTLVGGFNQQFFDIFPGIESEVYAAGIDYKLSKHTYFGAEGIHRDISRRFSFSESSLDIDTAEGVLGQGIELFPAESEQEEMIYRAYIYQVLGNRTTSTLDFLRSEMDDDTYLTEAHTNAFRLGVNYFDRSGWFTFGRGAWREQDLDGYDEQGAEDGVRDFWIVDAGLGYQLEKRHGQITLTLHNILDQDFRYLPTGLESPIYPGISGVVAFSVNF